MSLRRGMRMLFAAAIAATFIVPTAGPAHAHDRAPSTGLKTVAFAKAPPDFAFDSGGGPERLSALVGKPVVLSFWATWCRPCIDELDAFSKLQQLYDERAVLVTISQEAPGTARAYLEQHGLSLPVVDDVEHKIFDAYSVVRIPVTIVIRPDGTVADVTIGELSWPELQAQVDSVLAPVSTTAAVPAR